MENDLLNEQYQGFAEGNREMLDTLMKALTAGSGVDTASFTSGRAMTPESLDTTLVNVLWDQNEAVLFKALKKQPVKSPVHQYARRTGVGDGDGAWVAEGGNSFEKDQSLERVNVTMKFLQTLRKATLQATITTMLEDAITSEKMAGTLWLIKQVESILFDGDSANVTEEPDGLRALIWAKRATITKGNIIDVHGKDASSKEFEDAVNEGARVIRGKFGMPTDLYTSLIVMEDVQKLIRDRMRFPADKSGVILPTMVFDAYPTPFGKLSLRPDLFLLERGIPVTGSLTEKPSQVTLATVLTPADAANSNFKAADAGEYYYAVSAVSKFGESVVSSEIQCSGLAAGDKVTIEITAGATAGTAYKIFRNKLGAGSSALKYHVGTIPAGTSGTAHSVDWNDWMPGCSDAFMLGMAPMYDAIEWEQFLPMMKFDLYPTNAAVYPFLLLLFGALAVKKPEQQVIIRNVAPSKLGWF